MSTPCGDPAEGRAGAAPGTTGPAGGTGGRRELFIAMVLTVAGAAVTLVAAGRPWVHAVVALGPFQFEAAPLGNEVTAVPAALALVALAGVVAVLATRRVGRTIVGTLVFLAGAGIGASVAYSATNRSALEDLVAQAANLTSAMGGRIEITAWPWVTIGGGLLVAAAGLLTAVRGPAWPGMGSRYEAPGQAQSIEGRTPARTTGGMWDALDRGEDPTG